jgi:competence protein ComEC
MSAVREEETREIDARLAVGATTAWIATLAGLHAPVGVVLSVAVGAGITGVSVLLAPRWLGGRRAHPQHATARRARWRGRLRRGGPAFALGCLCVTIIGLPLAAELYQVQAPPLRELVAARATAVVELTVDADPHHIATGTIFGASTVAVDATLTAISDGRHRSTVKVAVLVFAPADAWARLGPGQRVRTDARAQPATSGELLGALLTARGPPTLLGRPPWWQRLAVQVRTSLRSACEGLPPLERGLLPGLVDGDTSGLDPQLATQFRTAGLTHLVAVSGTNAAILIGAVLLVLRRLRAPPWLCATLGGLTVAAFVIVARPQPSVLRAAVMASVLLVALASGRPRQGLPAVSAAVLVLLAWHPEWAGNAGFAMSVLATGALLLIAPGWADALRARHVPVGIAEGLAVAAAATAVCAPVIVLLSGRISLVSLPANLLAELVVAPATVLGVLAAATAPWAPGLAVIFVWGAGYPCRWLVAVAQLFGSLPGATVDWPQSVPGALALALMVLALVGLVRFPRARRPLLAAAITALLVQIPVRSWTAGWPVPGAVLVACDIGQGDGLVLPAGGHDAVVVDSGPDPALMDQCLRGLGITTVLIYVQTHFDLDHVGGVAGVMRGRAVGTVLTGPLPLPAGGRALLDAALHEAHRASTVAVAGSSLDAGRVHLDVLAAHVVDVDGVPDSNNSGVVLRATVAGVRILLLADIGVPVQQDLLASGVDLRADILKVAHHGSADFDPDLYAAVHASLAVISVGAHNTYGHPTPTALAELARLGVPVCRTDQDGDVAVVGSAGDLRTIDHHPMGVPVTQRARAPPNRE